MMKKSCAIVLAIASIIFSAAGFHSSQAMRGGFAVTSLGMPVYSQTMGATTTNGFVAAIPLSSSALLPSVAPSGAGTIAAGTAVLTITGAANSNFAVGQTIFNNSGGLRYGKIISGTCGSTCTGTGGNGTYQLDTTQPSLISATFTASPGARQFWVNTATGNNITYNGLSPCAGYPLNGSGPNFQYGATGCSATPNSAYGPYETVAQAFYQQVQCQQCGTANQIFMAEGQSFFDGGAIFTATFNGTTTMTVTGTNTWGFIEGGLSALTLTGSSSFTIIKQLTSTVSGGARGGAGTYQISTSSITSASNGTVSAYSTGSDLGVGLNFRNGESALFPLAFQSYNVADPLNTSKQGRATGSSRANFSCDPPPSYFTATVASTATGATLTIDSGSIYGTPSINNIGGRFLTAFGGGTVVPNTYVTGATNALVYTLNISQNITDQLFKLDGLSRGCQLFSYGRTDNPTTPQVQGNWALRGINVQSAAGWTGGGPGIVIGGNAYNILIENDVAVNGGFGGGGTSPAGSSINNTTNLIIRHTGSGSNWLNKAGVGASGIGTGTTNQLYVEDNTVYQGGWAPDTNGREASTSLATVSGSTLTINGSVSGTIALGQYLGGPSFLISNNIGANSCTGSACNGSVWTLSSSPGNVTNSLTLTLNGYAPNVFDHSHYAFHGSHDQNVARRNVLIAGSASGLSGRGPMLAYNNVWIDNPIQAVEGGGSSSNYATVGGFQASIAGTVMTVVSMDNPQPVWNGAIYPGQTTRLYCTASCLTGVPLITSQILPLNAGETIGGIGRYNISINESSISQQAMTTQSPSYMSEVPGGALLNYHDNLIMGGACIHDSPLFSCGNGLPSLNGVPGSNNNNNLFVNNPYYGNSLAFTFQNSAGADTPSYMDYNNNVGYNSTINLNYTAGSAYPAQVFTTFGGSPTGPATNVINHWSLNCGTCSYNSSTGDVTVTLGTAATFPTGSIIAMQLTGTGTDIGLLQSGNIPAQSGVYTSTSVSGSTVIFNIGSGKSISSITGGDISFSPASNQAVFSALGFASEAAMGAYMVANPDLNWAYAILQRAAPMFNNFPFQLNYLEKRDVDPASNDNDPMWLAKAA